jgi:hypothetical protein
MRKLGLILLGIYFLNNCYSQKVIYSSIKAKYDSIKSSLSHELTEVADSFEYSCLEQKRVFSLVYNQQLIFDSIKLNNQKDGTFKQLKELFFVVNLGEFFKHKTLNKRIIPFGLPFGNAIQFFKIQRNSYNSYMSIFFKYDSCLSNKLTESPKNDISVAIDYKNSKFFKDEFKINKDLLLFEFDFVTKTFYYITPNKNYIPLKYKLKGFLVVHKSAFTN